MNLKKYLECELKQMDKYTLLPFRFKKIGWLLVIVSIILSAIDLFTHILPEKAEMIYGNLFVIGLLVVAVSRERIEDEYINKLRMRSYTIGFISAVAYSIVISFVPLIGGLIFGSEKFGYEAVDSWIVLWLMLITQILYFRMYKKVA